MNAANTLNTLDKNAFTRIIPFPSYLTTETTLFNLARRYTPSYTGGRWHISTRNGMEFFVPPAKHYDVSNPDNYFDGIMDEFDFGAALTVMTYNRMLWRYQDKLKDWQTDRFYTLRDALATTPDILRFLD